MKSIHDFRCDRSNFLIELCVDPDSCNGIKYRQLTISIQTVSPPESIINPNPNTNDKKRRNIKGELITLYRYCSDILDFEDKKGGLNTPIDILLDRLNLDPVTKNILLKNYFFSLKQVNDIC